VDASQVATKAFRSEFNTRETDSFLLFLNWYITEKAPPNFIWRGLFFIGFFSVSQKNEVMDLEIHLVVLPQKFYPAIYPKFYPDFLPKTGLRNLFHIKHL
jgi:hypothetical protein